jgi:hypothetical protein
MSGSLAAIKGVQGSTGLLVYLLQTISSNVSLLKFSNGPHLSCGLRPECLVKTNVRCTTSEQQKVIHGVQIRPAFVC